LAATTTTALFTLAGALGGVLLTGIIGITRTWFDHRHERRIKELEVQLETESTRKADRRQCYATFSTSTDGAYQLAANLYARAKSGQVLSFRNETRDVISDLMRQELTVALVGTKDVRQDANRYVQALRQLLVDAGKGQWKDSTAESRHTLFESMISDINPGAKFEQVGQTPPLITMPTPPPLAPTPTPTPIAQATTGTATQQEP
jgi:hypothetical protein